MLRLACELRGGVPPPGAAVLMFSYAGELWSRAAAVGLACALAAVVRQAASSAGGIHLYSEQGRRTQQSVLMGVLHRRCLVATALYSLLLPAGFALFGQEAVSAGMQCSLPYGWAQYWAGCLGMFGCLLVLVWVHSVVPEQRQLRMAMLPRCVPAARCASPHARHC